MKNDNKGFSLVELLIALAVSGIVLSALAVLITQSVISYSKQTALAQIQSDADISLNQIQKNIMEATEVKILKKKVGASPEEYNVELYTDMKVENVVDSVTGVSVPDTTEWGYYYDYDKKILYYTSESDKNNSEQLSVVCDNVTAFDVKFEAGSIDMGSEGKIENVSSHPQLIVSITIERMGQERTVSRTFTTRNPFNSKDTNLKIGKSFDETEDDLTAISVGKTLTTSQINCYIGKH